MRHEPIEPFERTLAYAGGQIAYALGDDPVHGDPRYVLGRIDALLDLCDMGIDRSVSDSVVAEVGRRARALDILRHLVQEGEERAGDLACAVGIERNHLSNVLHWMEMADLIRRVAAGRYTMVSLGPKGEAVYRALEADQATGATTRHAAAPVAATSARHTDPIGGGYRTEKQQVSYGEGESLPNVEASVASAANDVKPVAA